MKIVVKNQFKKFNICNIFLTDKGIRHKKSHTRVLVDVESEKCGVSDQ